MVKKMNRLRELRIQKRLKQKEVADILGISQSAYSYWENGQVRIDNDSLKKLSEFYNATIDYLLGNTDAPNRITISDGVSIGWVQVVDDAITKGLTPEEVKQLIEIAHAYRPKNIDK
jgi:transcriptional regulator with XRE-family HTH domain